MLVSWSGDIGSSPVFALNILCKFLITFTKRSFCIKVITAALHVVDTSSILVKIIIQ